MENLKYKRIRIPEKDRGNLLKICGHLPYNSTIEVGGYITENGIYFVEGSRDNVPVPDKYSTVFHTHPEGPRGDLPSELDILNLIFMDWKNSILLTRNRLIILSKTPATEAIIGELDRAHEKHAMDAATLLRTRGPDSVFYFLVKKFVKRHMIPHGISHHTWPMRWEEFVTQVLKMDLKLWDCVPVCDAA